MNTEYIGSCWDKFRKLPKSQCLPFLTGGKHLHLLVIASVNDSFLLSVQYHVTVVVVG